MPGLLPLATLWVWVVSVAAAVAACSECALLRPGSYCLSHVCLDCAGVAHPAGLSVGC